MLRRITALALAAALALAPTSALPKSSSSGFSSSSSSSYKPSSSSSSSSTSGFRASERSSYAAPAAPSTASDRAMSRAVSGASQTPSRPYVPPSQPSAAPSAPSYSGGSSPTVVHHYHENYDGGGYSNGVLAGLLVGQLSQPRPRDADADEYREENRRLKDRLRELQDDPSVDPAERERIKASVAVFEQQDAQAPVEQPSSGHGVLWALLIVVGAVALGAFLFLRRRAPSTRANSIHRFGYEPTTPQRSAPVTQQQRVELDSVPFVLATAAGSVVDDLSGAHAVTVTGTLDTPGGRVIRHYFGVPGLQQASFLEFVGGGLRVYHMVDERYPEDQEEWDFFTGPDGLIGKAHVEHEGRAYDRFWAPGDKRVSPLRMTETLVGAASAPVTNTHDLMLYSRPLGDGKTVEYLYMDRVATNNGTGASIEVWAGIDVTEATARVS